MKAAIREAVSILEDFRMQKLGGILAGFDLWELAIIPSLLNNAETLVEIIETSMKKLEELQYMFLRIILRTSASTPKIALNSKSRMLPMRLGIAMRKLVFVNELKNMEEKTLV